jgi:hypothetical protein
MRILGVKADDSAVGILGLPAPCRAHREKLGLSAPPGAASPFLGLSALRGALRVKLGLSAPRGAHRELLNRLWKKTQEGQPPGI